MKRNKQFYSEHTKHIPRTLKKKRWIFKQDKLSHEFKGNEAPNTTNLLSDEGSHQLNMQYEYSVHTDNSNTHNNAYKYLPSHSYYQHSNNLEHRDIAHVPYTYHQQENFNHEYAMKHETPYQYAVSKPLPPSPPPPSYYSPYTPHTTHKQEYNMPYVTSESRSPTYSTLPFRNHSRGIAKNNFKMTTSLQEPIKNKYHNYLTQEQTTSPHTQDHCLLHALPMKNYITQNYQQHTNKQLNGRYSWHHYHKKKNYFQKQNYKSYTLENSNHLSNKPSTTNNEQASNDKSSINGSSPSGNSVSNANHNTHLYVKEQEKQDKKVRTSISISQLLN